MKKFDMYIAFIFLIKIGFIVTAVTHLYLKTKGDDYSAIDQEILYWKQHFEFIFIAAMATLLIFLFNPLANRITIIDRETKLLLYLFGIVLLITAKWDVFFQESHLFQLIQRAVGPTH
ncbi:MAG: hypothetical protein ACOVRN_04630 [Flavobacterium sp.]